MEEKLNDGIRCKATAKRTKKRCRHRALAGSDYCRAHAGQGVATSATGEAAAAGLREHLKDIIERKANAPDLLELKVGVATIRTLLEEHLARLDEIRDKDAGAEDEEKKYNGALEAHGKRIQSLAGELFASIDKVGRIEERRRMVLTADEAAALISEIKERVIRAAESWSADEPPAELARRLAEAFDSAVIFERDDDQEQGKNEEL